MTKIYSYVIEHDYGLAPNPFGGYCTLAVCKPKIRKSTYLNIGDWIIGTGSRSLEKATKEKYIGKLIYAMKIDERINFNQYWNDERFQYKKPVPHGSLSNMYGDNIYYSDEQNVFHQIDSAHSNEDGSINKQHLKRDTEGKNVLISNTFYYFGENAPIIPKLFRNICHAGIGEKKIVENEATDFIDWLTANFKKGIHGDPVNWIKYKQLKLL